ncbi:hypothetical protein Ccrd_003959 [Cynara cardunculus var. scolymus]|uniref:Uncharacterized protein n=1 Tax=Cynara cardunculus var. scolymus TaxID=59895 RepID=A0A103XNH2_CYNCS|nr:hypothetical protein Ccrd_003959 [Cynara cardunculus var. scolymus]
MSSHFQKQRTTGTTPCSTSPPSSSLLDFFASNPIFSGFLSSDIDSTPFSSEALSSGTVTARAENIQDDIRKQLHSEVLSRHNDLLSQLSSISWFDFTGSISQVRFHRFHKFDFSGSISQIS